MGVALLAGCSGADPDLSFPTTPPTPTGVFADGGGSSASGPDAGASRDGASTGNPTTADARPSGSPVGSGGSGGPGPGEHDIAFKSKSVALHVPAGVKVGTPTPLLVLLHGQGDTGRNFLNVWLARGYPADLILAAPDDNTDENALAVEQHLRGVFDVDVAREYLFGFSQGGAYAAFVLFDASAASHFAAVGLASSGLAANPSSIPMATAKSPAVAVVIDPADQNNTWNQGLHVMEEFVPFMTARGYDAKLFLHQQGHTISAPEVATTVTWMLGKTKAP